MLMVGTDRRPIADASSQIMKNIFCTKNLEPTSLPSGLSSDLRSTQRLPRNVDRFCCRGTRAFVAALAGQATISTAHLVSRADPAQGPRPEAVSGPQSRMGHHLGKLGQRAGSASSASWRRSRPPQRTGGQRAPHGCPVWRNYIGSTSEFPELEPKPT